MNKDSETKERPCEIRCNNCSKILRATQANPNDSCSCGVKIHLYPIASAAPLETITLSGNAPCPPLCPCNGCIQKRLALETSSWKEFDKAVVGLLEMLNLQNALYLNRPVGMHYEYPHPEFHKLRDPFRKLLSSEYKRGRNEARLEIAENFDEIPYVKALKESEYKRGQQQERQFILNILDGIDQADKEMKNQGGGTKAIRHALQSRII